MKRLLLAVGLLALCPLLACGPAGNTDAGYVDSGIPCSGSAECPALRCLPDGGQAEADAGNVATVRMCAFGRCKDRCD